MSRAGETSESQQDSDEPTEIVLAFSGILLLMTFKKEKKKQVNKTNKPPKFPQEKTKIIKQEPSHTSLGLCAPWLVAAQFQCPSLWLHCLLLFLSRLLCLLFIRAFVIEFRTHLDDPGNLLFSEFLMTLAKPLFPYQAIFTGSRN